MSERLLPDDEVDRLLREALADDLPKELEDELRGGAREAWRRAASGARPARWRDWFPSVWRPLVPQTALVAASLAMLAAGAVMQAAPAPHSVVASLEGRQAAARVARAMGRATAMECTVQVSDDHGRQLRHRIDWKAPGETRVRLDGAGGRAERTLRLPGAAPSVLTRAAVARDGASRDPEIEHLRAFLSPLALWERLAAPWRPEPGREGKAPAAGAFVVAPRPGAPGLTVTVDPATHLPLWLDGTDRDGRKQAAVCRWP